MRKTIVLCIMLLPVFGISAIAHEQKPSITFAGEAIVLAVPDRAVVTLSIQTVQYSQRADAKRLLDSRATTLVNYFDRAGVSERKYKSIRRQISPVYERSSGMSNLVGYSGYQSFQVKLALDDADEFLELLPDIANEDSVTFFVSNARELRDAAVDLAIEDAKARAQRRAGVLGITLGGVIGQTESNLGQGQARESGRVMAAMSADASVQLPAGENELRVNVTVTYRILESVQ